MQVKISQAIAMVTAYLHAKLVPLIIGSPGIGKSQIVYQIAKEYNLFVIDLRLSQCDPTDLSGFPSIVGGKSDYVPMKHFPIEGDEIPEGYSGWLLFLDEITSAPQSIQAASYKLILDRMVGSHHLHKNVAIVAAGNMETDNAIVESMSTALQSRLAHIELIVDAEEFTTHAAKQKFDHRIVSFNKYKPGMVFTFTPDHTDKTYACPRTWEFVNRIINSTPEDSPLRLPLFSGVVSEGVAREFLAFMKICNDLPTPQQINANPETIKVPTEPSILFAITGSIAHNATADNLESFMKFVVRIPEEFQVVCLREMIRRNKKLLGHPAIAAWLQKAKVMLD